MTRARLLPLSALWLTLLLQRTPTLRVAACTEFPAPSRIVALLQAAVATLGSLGAVHSLAGATQFVVSSRNVIATVGTVITPVAFTVTGAAIPAGSFRITGSLPPGLTVPGANASGVLNGSNGLITGTPTTAGTYNVSILAYERANATGSPAPTYQWRKNGVLIAGATGPVYTLTNVQAADAGAYTVTVSNSLGIVTSTPATVAVDAGSAVPVFTAQPQSQYVAAGSRVTLAAAAGPGITYQWKKDGTVLTGATQSTLTFTSAAAEDMGFYSVTATSGVTSLESAIATLTVNTGGSSRLVNVSTRGFVPAGGTLTPGFVLQGTPTKTVLIRAVGPTLGAFGVGGTLADPVMDVIPLGSSAAVATNDNWGGGSALIAAFSRVGAFPLATGTSTDASVATALTATGASGYTVRITSKNAAASGIALAEVYDEEALTAPVRLVNVSTSGFVGTGEQALVPGFVIGGTAPKQLLIRAVGPGLVPFGVSGVLADPQLTVTPLGRNFVVAASDNWGGSTVLAAAFSSAGAFALPASSNDAAVVVRLPPGGYTVVVSGVGNTTGTALVEVYDLDP